MKCPTCAIEIPAAVAMDLSDTQPQPGNLCVCAYCKTVNEVTDARGLRAMTPDELRALPRRARQQITLAKRSIDRVRAQRAAAAL